jgi:hypothetical protein
MARIKSKKRGKTKAAKEISVALLLGQSRNSRRLQNGPKK